MRPKLTSSVVHFNHNVALFSFTSTDPGLHGGLCLAAFELYLTGC